MTSIDRENGVLNSDISLTPGGKLTLGNSGNAWVNFHDSAIAFAPNGTDVAHVDTNGLRLDDGNQISFNTAGDKYLKFRSSDGAFALINGTDFTEISAAHGIGLFANTLDGHTPAGYPDENNQDTRSWYYPDFLLEDNGKVLVESPAGATPNQCYFNMAFDQGLDVGRHDTIRITGGANFQFHGYTAIMEFGYFSDGSNLTGSSLHATLPLTIDSATVNFTGTILAADGSLGAPSYSFASQSGFGFYMQGSDGIGTTCDFAIPEGNNLCLGDISAVDFALTFTTGYPGAPASALIVLLNGGVISSWDHATGDFSTAGHQIHDVIDPTLAQDAATKVYVDNIAAGLDVKAAVRVATTANLTSTPSGSGVGKTLTNSGTQVALSIDGVALSVNDRVLVKNQTTTKDNGIYSVTDIGNVSTNWVLTRATDFDGSPSNEVAGGDFTFVEAGTQGGSGWTVIFNGNIVVDTDNIVWTQFNTTITYTADESTLHLSGNTFSVKTGFSPLLGGNGTVSAPTYSFNGDSTTGIYRFGTSNIGFTAGGVNSLQVTGDAIYPLFHVRAPDGSAGTPMYTFDNDPDTGIFRIAANTIGFAANGTETFRMNNTSIEMRNSSVIYLTDGTLGTPAITFATDPDTGFRLGGSGVIDVVGNGASMFDFNPTVNRSKVLFQVLAGAVQSTNGTVSAPAFSFAGNSGTGLYRGGVGNALTVTVNGIDACYFTEAASPQLQVSGGGASAPTYSFGSDSDTGIFSAGANAIGFAAGGADIIEITGADIRPGSDNSYSCGESGRRWTTVYATTGTINTSHSSTKQNIVALDWENLQVPAGVEYDRDGRRHMGYLNDSLPDVARPFNSDGTISQRDNYENAVIGILCATVNGLKEEVKALKAKLGV